MDEMDSMMGKPEPAPATAKPEPKADAPKPATAIPPKDESGKFVAKPKEVKDPVELRKHVAKLEADLNHTRTEKENTVRELQTKMADLEKRPFLTKDQQERYDALEKRAKELEAHLYSQDYSQSPEYQEKFQKRWQAKYKSSVSEVGRLQVKTTNAETGEESTRLATQADFERVRSLRGSEAAQLDEAERIFGNRAVLVMKYCNELDAIEQQAQEEVQTRRAKFDEEVSQRGTKFQEFNAAVKKSALDTETQMQTRYAEWFGKSDDPEIDTAMKKGLDFVDAAAADADKLTPEERGSKLALIRMWAAAFPRNVHRIQKQNAEIAELKAQIARLQGTDPGAGGDGGSPEKTSDTPKGTAGMMAEFN